MRSTSGLTSHWRGITSSVSVTSSLSLASFADPQQSQDVGPAMTTRSRGSRIRGFHGRPRSSGEARTRRASGRRRVTTDRQIGDRLPVDPLTVQRLFGFSGVDHRQDQRRPALLLADPHRSVLGQHLDGAIAAPELGDRRTPVPAIIPMGRRRRRHARRRAALPPSPSRSYACRRRQGDRQRS